MYNTGKNAAKVQQKWKSTAKKYKNLGHKLNNVCYKINMENGLNI